MFRSKFFLCPRGTGTSSIRLYETLSAGRVPVIALSGSRHGWPEAALLRGDTATARERAAALAEKIRAEK